MDNFDPYKANEDLFKVINYLHEALKQVVFEKTGKTGDFSTLLRIISDNNERKKFTYSYTKEFEKICKRAIGIRNETCHHVFTDFDNNEYEHDMACLEKLASLIQRPDIEKKIHDIRCSPETNKLIAPDKYDAEFLRLKENGNVFYKEERWTEAMNCYTQAIKQFPKEATLFFNRALCELKLKKYQLAREDAEDARDLDPNRVKYYRLLSEALVGLNLHKEAVDVCENGLKIDPRDEFLLIQLRDCKAIVSSVEINAANPRPWLEKGYDHLQNEVFKKLPDTLKISNKLTLKSEDIKVLNKKEFFDYFQMTLFVGKAHKLCMGSKSVSKNEKEAMEIFKQAANNGSAEGLYNLAKFYSDGKGGLTKDFSKARDLLFEAASQKPFFQYRDWRQENLGVIAAENSIGNRYRDDKGEDIDERKALQWYLKAAEHGSPEGQNNVGIAFLRGDGCVKDYATARKWFERAAQQKIAEAQLNLGDMLRDGLGGEKDIHRATDLYKLAADQGQCEALFKWQDILTSEVLGEPSTSDPYDLIRQRAEDMQDPNAYFMLGYNHFYGTGGAVYDFNLAKEFFEKAVDLGNKDAAMPLANLLIELKLNKEAFDCILKAANIEIPEAALLLSEFYAFGHGCTRDEVQSRRWFNRAKYRNPLNFIFESIGSGLTDQYLNDSLIVGQKIIEFEENMKLSIDNMSINDRRCRFDLANNRLNEGCSNELMKENDDCKIA